MLDTLKRFLPMAEKVIPRRTTLSIIENVCIDDGVIRATDLDISLSMQIESELSCLIPVKILKTILKTKPGRLEGEYIDHEKLRLSYDNRAVEFPADDLSDYPRTMTLRFQDVGTWDKAMIMTMHSLTAFCSDDDLRPAMTGIYIRQNGDIKMVATDGHVLKKVTMDGEFKPMTVILPKRLIQILSRIVKRRVQVGVADDYVRLIVDHDVELVVKTIPETYPDVDRVIPKKFKHHVIVDKNKILDLLFDARAFADSPGRRATLIFSKEKLDINVENYERGITWKAMIAVDGDISENYKIAVNVDYLDKVLKDIVEDRIRCRFNDAGEAMLINGVGVTSEVILLMPIRLEEDEDEDE